MSKVELGFTVIQVTNLQEIRKFMTEAFGMVPGRVAEDQGFAEFGDGPRRWSFATKLAIQSLLQPAPTMQDRSGSESKVCGSIESSVDSRDNEADRRTFHLSLRTRNLKETHAQAIEAGGRQIAPPTLKDWGQWISLVEGPEALVFEIVEIEASKTKG